MTSSALVIGEILVDIVHHADGRQVEHAGGSPANVAVGLVRLGTPVQLLTAYADDRLGALLADHLTTAGVVLAADPHVLERTPSAVATLGADGAATYVFDLAWDLPPVAFDDPPRLVHTGSLGAVLEPGGAVVAELLETLRGAATISYDVNARPAATGVSAGLVAQVERIVAVSDVVKASDEDLLTLYPDVEVDVTVARLLDLGAGAVVVTWGGAGATCHTPLGDFRIDAETVTVADTIGAGDSFCATMLDGLRRADLLGGDRRSDLRGLPLDRWREILLRANRAAAITVSRPGADPPTAAELDS